jgi:hypothetical protein
VLGKGSHEWAKQRLRLATLKTHLSTPHFGSGCPLPQLFPHLIGQKGRTRQRVEQDTGAELSFPIKR